MTPDEGQGAGGGCRRGLLVALTLVVALVAIIGIGIARLDRRTLSSAERACTASGEELVLAAAAGDHTEIDVLLSRGVDAGVVDRAGNTPLACAGAAGHLEAVEALLDAGASPDRLARDGDTPVFDAVQHCRPEVLTALLDAGADPDATGRYEVPPLRLAADRGHLAIVEQLLEGGADPSRIDGVGIGFPEHSDTCSAQTVAIALAARAVLDADGDAGWVLSVAVRSGDAPLATDALTAGAGADHRYAAGSGSLEAVLCFVDGLDTLGPEHCSSIDVLQVLVLDEGRAPGAVPVLVEAAGRGQLDIVALLLDAGADPDDATDEGLRAIHAATAFAHEDVVALLIDRGADPNPTEPMTPAALRELLLDHQQAIQATVLPPGTSSAAPIP